MSHNKAKRPSPTGEPGHRSAHQQTFKDTAHRDKHAPFGHHEPFGAKKEPPSCTNTAATVRAHCCYTLCARPRCCAHAPMRSRASSPARAHTSSRSRAAAWDNCSACSSSETSRTHCVCKASVGPRLVWKGASTTSQPGGQQRSSCRPSQSHEAFCYVAITIQDSAASRLLPGSRYSCTTHNLHSSNVEPSPMFWTFSTSHIRMVCTPHGLCR
jgi:hypothetical protein